jgi:hypothetical protein
MHKQSAHNSTPSNLQLTKQCKFSLSGCLHTRKCIVRDFGLTEKLANILFFWNVTTCELVYRRQRFEGVFCFHLQGT